MDIKRQVSLAHPRLAQIPTRNRRAVEEHTPILNALSTGDAAAAGNAVESHPRAVRRRVLDGFIPVGGDPEE